MAASTQAANVLQSLEGHALLTAQITFDGEGFRGTSEFLDVPVLEILDSDVGVDTCFGQDGSSPVRADSIDVGKGNFDPLVAGNVNAGDPCQGNSIDEGTEASGTPEAKTGW